MGDPRWTIDGDYLVWDGSPEPIHIIPSRTRGVAVRMADVPTAVVQVEALDALVAAVRDADRVPELEAENAALRKLADALAEPLTQMVNLEHRPAVKRAMALYSDLLAPVSGTGTQDTSDE